MYRKGVSALILNKNNEILLVNLTSFEHTYFAIPGGGVDGDETLEEAIYREIQEELSIKKESLVFVGKSDIPVNIIFKEIKLNREGKKYLGSERYFFGFNFIGNNDEIKIKKDEVRCYQWTALNDLKDYLLFDNQLTETQEKIKEIFSLEG